MAMTCVSYATGIALGATLDFRYRGALSIPAFPVWRPALLSKSQFVVSPSQVTTFAWLGLLIGTVIIAASQLRSYWINRSSDLTAEINLAFFLLE